MALPAPAIISSILDLGLGIGRTVFGTQQRNQARADLEDLKGKRPAAYITEATRRLANEPLTEELVQQLSDSRARRMSQTLGAVSASDPASVAFTAQRAADVDRMTELQDVATLEQERKRALERLGAEESALQKTKYDRWLSQVEGAKAELGAGQENIYGGAAKMGKAIAYGYGQQYDPVDKKLTWS